LRAYTGQPRHVCRMSEALGQRARAATRTSSVPLQLLALLALYAIFYQLGRASGPLSWQQRCTCPEAARTLSIREGLSPDEVKGIADCVLHDQPTRGRLHGRLARCIGRSAWQIPGRPSSSGGGGSISSSSSWEDVNSATAEDAFDDSSSSSSDGDGLGGSSSADSAAVDADEGEDDEDEGDDEEELVSAVPSTSSEGASSDESVSAEERAARMMAAIREHPWINAKKFADMSQGTYNVNAEVGEDQPMYRGGLGMGDEVEMMIDEDEAPVYRSLGGGAPEPPAMPGLMRQKAQLNLFESPVSGFDALDALTVQ